MWIFDDLSEAIEVNKQLKKDFPLNKRFISNFEKNDSEFQSGKTAICVVESSTQEYIGAKY